MKNSIKQEIPQIVNGIIAIFGLFCAFGIVTVTPEQLEKLQVALPYLVGGVVSILSIVVYVANRFITRRFVTPVHNPKNNDGERLVPETAVSDHVK